MLLCSRVILNFDPPDPRSSSSSRIAVVVENYFTIKISTILCNNNVLTFHYCVIVHIRYTLLKIWRPSFCVLLYTFMSWNESIGVKVWNNVWRHASLRLLTWTSPDQHRFTASEPVLKSTLMITWLSADQQASWSAKLSSRTFHGYQRKKTCWAERSVVKDVTRVTRLVWRTVSTLMYRQCVRRVNILFAVNKIVL